MSDTPLPPLPPTPPVPPVIPPEGTSPPESAQGPEPDVSLWGRYRTSPIWLQILIPVVLLAILIGIWVIATGGTDDSAASDTTVPESNLDRVLSGIIIAGGIRGETTTTTSEVATSEPTSASTEPTTTAPETTLAPTTLAPTTTAGGTPAPTTPATTAPPTTAPPTTTAATTTTTEAAPPSTEAPASVLPSPDDFLAQWNAAVDGTNVPSLSRDQITKIVDGPFAGAFLATLSPTVGNKMAPQVGLIGTMSATDPTQIAELLLVYVNGPDESASDFYWESFGVLTQAVDPVMTDAEITALETSLGRDDGTPPFPAGTDNTASSNGFNYNLYTGSTQDGTAATGIAVT